MNATAGFILGLVGGLLDFISGTNIFIGSMPGGSIMASPMGVPNIVWVDGLYILGGAVLVTAFLSVSSYAASMMVSRALMVTYGIVMLIVGWAMAAGTSLMTTPVYGYGMIVLGVLMVANGALMRRPMMARM